MPPKLLWLEASPKGERSLSTACARAFLDALAESQPDVEVTNLNVWTTELPEFGAEAAIAKFAPLFGETVTDEQRLIWRRVEQHIEFVKDHDAVLVSSPMWNWNVPYRFKQWIDIVTQPLLSFTLDADLRHVGVLGVGKRVQLLLTRSSAYDGRSPELEDHQQPYLEFIFGMLGYRVEPSVVIEPTTAWTPEARDQVAADARARAAEAGRRFEVGPGSGDPHG
jgi:FMN-dependent NADH-azoreductase